VNGTVASTDEARETSQPSPGLPLMAQPSTWAAVIAAVALAWLAWSRVYFRDL
jgi:hypothetical protein